MKATTKLFCFFIFTLFVLQKSIAQTDSSYYHSLRKPGIPTSTATIPTAERSSGQSGTGANIDVIYQRCNWRINPDSSAKAIGGSVTFHFKTTQASVSTISFDLNSVLTITNIRFRGANLPGGNIARSGHIVTVTLGATLANSFIDSFTVFYNGIPPAVSGAAQGYQRGNNATAGNYINTLSESYEDRDWWPCKADMKDKIDSMDIVVSVPWGSPAAGDTFWVATNGKLISSPIIGNSRIFTFQTRYPIASYLVSLGIARFNKYYRTVNIGGTNVNVEYNLLRGKAAGTYTTILTAMDKMNLVLTAFSNKFGDYPFKNEKHGFYEALQGAGGMEHQTFSAIATGSISSVGTLAHELGHQWWGDKVTFATWNELWLAEGFARYCEALAAELVPSLGLDPVAERSSAKTSAQSVSTFPCYIPSSSMSTSNLIWNTSYGTSVYERGAMVVSMLRMLLGDTKFFQACTNYMNDPALAYKSATTTDLKNHMQAVAGGYDLTPFFDSWVYGNGHPSYNTTNRIQWSALGTNRINLRVISQTRSAGSTVAYYHTPIALRVQGAAGKDTVIVLYDQNGKLSRGGNGITGTVTGNTLAFNIGFIPTSVTFDPFSQTLANGGTVVNATLPVLINDFTVQERSFGNELKISLFDQHNELSKVVLQKSMDGINFTDAGEMIKADNDGDMVVYKFIDNLLNEGKIYYRARIIDINEENYSKLLSVERAKLEFTSVAPNPADKQVLINWSKTFGDNTDAEVKLLAIDGRTVWSQRTTGNRVTVNTSTMPAGTYLVQVIQNNETILNKKLIIRR